MGQLPLPLDAQAGRSERLVVGLIGYPNVGESLPSAPSYSQFASNKYIRPLESYWLRGC